MNLKVAYIIGLTNNELILHLKMKPNNLDTICPSLILFIKVKSCSRVVLVEPDAGSE